MIRIVGVQRSESVGQEFVLLQNQGSMRASLKGHAVVAESAIDGGEALSALHLFADEVDVMPGQFVLLRTCMGAGHWSVTQEGQRVHYSYMNRLAPVWSRFLGTLHVLAPQHTFVERSVEAILV